MEGPLPRRNTLQLALPLKPHKIELTVQGWSVEGVHDDGQVVDQLQLTRKQPAGPSAPAALEAAVLPLLLRVERTLLLGLNWQVDTRVVRVTPPGSAALAEIPVGDRKPAPFLRRPHPRSLFVRELLGLPLWAEPQESVVTPRLAGV
jgi:hypothetical protein